MTDLFNWLPALGTQLLCLHEGFWATAPGKFSLQICMWGSDLTQNGLTSDRNKWTKNEVCKSTVTSREESEVRQWQENVLYHPWEFLEFGESHTLNNPLTLGVVPGPTSTGGHRPQGSVSKSFINIPDQRTHLKRKERWPVCFNSLAILPHRFF